jgi:hypothetical protein
MNLTPPDLRDVVHGQVVQQSRSRGMHAIERSDLRRNGRLHLDLHRSTVWHTEGGQRTLERLIDFNRINSAETRAPYSPRRRQEGLLRQLTQSSNSTVCASRAISAPLISTVPASTTTASA